MFLKRPMSKGLKKKAIRPTQAAVASGHESHHQEEEEEEELAESCLSSYTATSKKRRVQGSQAIFSTTVKPTPAEDQEIVTKTFFESDYALRDVAADQRATCVYEHDTPVEHDHRAILERNEKIGKALLAGELEEGVYRGIGAYRPIINRREGAISAGKHSGLYGPVRGNQHVRMTMRIDLNPKICKDYKETGYCGFGDTCIFLHDRSDYKPGWQLEKEWEEKQRKDQEKHLRKLRRVRKLETRKTGEEDTDEVENDPGTESSESDNDEEDEKGLPSHCYLCKKPWVISMKPVVTQCLHYFCEDCALTHYGTSSKCARCDEPTYGVFNTAILLIARLQR